MHSSSYANAPSLSSLSSSPPVEAPRQKSQVWLITFGDLLTLLLGFFITVIALTREEKIKTSHRLASSVQAASSVASSGIRLAQGKIEGLEHAPSSMPVLVLTDEHLADPRNSVLAKWLSEWTARGAAGFDFSLCQGSFEGPKVAEIVTGYVTSELPPQVAVRFVDVGISCGELRGRALGLQEAALARVIVQVSLVSNHG